MPLKVGGAFHTPLMRDASSGIADTLAGVALHSPAAPVVSNHDGALYDDAEGWRVRLPEHVTMPVRWRSCMEALAATGVDTFVEVGNGAMIAGVAKRTVPDVRVLPCGTPEECEALA
jgi:[acyl-carrier-protein] S-malonyltransferase